MVLEIKESPGFVIAGLREAITGKLSDFMRANTQSNILYTIVMERAPLLFLSE